MTPDIELAAGLYFIGFVAAMDTQDLVALAIFRIFPGLFGAALVLDAALRLGWAQ